MVWTEVHAQVLGNAFEKETATNFVWAMTVNTGGHFVGFLFPQLAANDLAVHLLNLPVTLLAGACNIIPMDR